MATESEEIEQVIFKSDTPVDTPVDTPTEDTKDKDEPINDEKDPDSELSGSDTESKDTDDESTDKEIKDEKSTDNEPVDDKDDNGGDKGKTNSGSEDTPEVQTEKFNSRLSKDLGEDFKSIDDVKSHISDLKAKAKPAEFSNDILEKFTEFSRGRNMDPIEGALLFLETQTQDFKEMDPMDVLRHELEMNHPNMSDDDIEFQIQDKYKLDEEEVYSEREVRAAKIQMSTDADKARKELIELQERIAMKPAQEEDAAPEMSEEDKIIQANFDNKRKQEVDDSMKDYDSISLPTTKDGESFTFGVDDTSRIRSVVDDPASLFSRYDVKDDSGKVIGADLNKFRDDMTLIQNQKAIFQALTSNGISIGKEEMLNQRKNPKDIDSGQNSNNGEKSDAENIVAGLRLAAGE